MTEIRADDYFAIVPEWVLYADISPNAVRLYAILNRYANSNGHAWPSRKTIANAMRCSTATVDRARDELTTIGAVTVIQRKTDAGDPTSNLYVLHTRPVGIGEKSSPVTQGLVTGAHTGTRTSDDLNRAIPIHSQSGTVATMKTTCGTCRGRRIIMQPAIETNEGTFAAPPIPCPDCNL